MDNILKYYILLHFIATFGPNNEILNFNQNFALPESLFFVIIPSSMQVNIAHWGDKSILCMLQNIAKKCPNNIKTGLFNHRMQISYGSCP